MIDIIKLFLKSVFSSDEKEIISYLYGLSASAGDFRRRFIFVKGEDLYFALNNDGTKEILPKEQFIKLLEIGKEGKLISGNTQCSLFPIENVTKRGETIGYWIVDSKKGLEVERLFPMVSALMTKLKEVEEGRKGNYKLKVFEEFMKDFEKVKEDCNSLCWVELLYKHLSKIFSINLIILGIADKNAFDISFCREGKSFLYDSKYLDFTIFFANRIVEYSEENSALFSDYREKFKTKLQGFLFSSFKFKDSDVKIFLICNTNQKPQEEDLVILDTFLFMMNCNREVCETREKEKYVSDCFTLVIKQLELKKKILDSIKYGILVISGNGNIRFVNKEAEELLDITQIELQEKVLFKSKEPGKTLFALLSRVEEKEKNLLVPVDVLDKKIDIEVSMIEKGMYLVFCKDSKLLRKEIEERKQLFSIISHEIKNTLSVLLSASEMLNSERAGKFTTDSQKKLAEMMYQNAKSMTKTLEDISVFNKIILRGEKDVENVSLKETIEKIIYGLNNSIKAKDLNIVLRLEDIFLPSNQAMIDTMLSNVIGNAVKYSSYKGNIGVKVQRMGDKVVFEVIDDGIGIPKEDLKRIGEPFFRAENVKDSIPGTGFGLTIVKNISERLNGTFKIVSPISFEDKLFIGDKSQRKCGTKVTVILSLGG